MKSQSPKCRTACLLFQSGKVLSRMSDSEDEGLEKQFKLVLLGDPQSGKTSIAQRSIWDE